MGGIRRHKSRDTNNHDHIREAYNCKKRKPGDPIVDFAVCPKCPLPRARRS